MSDNISDKKEQEPLATELLHEVKQQNKRLFIALTIVLCLWFATIGAFLWYVSLPVEETTTTTASVAGDDGITSYVDGNNEGDITQNG